VEDLGGVQQKNSDFREIYLIQNPLTPFEKLGKDEFNKKISQKM